MRPLNLTLHLIRHGMTPTNKSNATIGQPSDEPLDEIGKQQAKWLGERLRKEPNFDAVYASSYLRAHDTLKIAAPQVFGTHHLACQALREISQGDYQGKTRDDFFNDTELFGRMRRNGMGFSFPNGETQFDVQDRAWKFLSQEIFDNPYTRTDKHLNLGIFSHGMVIKCLIHKVLQNDHHLTGRIIIDNTSISKLRLKEGIWFVDVINDTAHLYGKEIGK
jgi:broad specificity phosphatase PhoE